MSACAILWLMVNAARLLWRDMGGGGGGLTVMVGGTVVKGNGGSGATLAGKGVHMQRER